MLNSTRIGILRAVRRINCLRPTRERATRRRTSRSRNHLDRAVQISEGSPALGRGVRRGRAAAPRNFAGLGANTRDVLLWRRASRGAGGGLAHHADESQTHRELGIVAFLYAVVFLVEGTGLWLQRRWAEYLTIVVTASLIPFEIHELMQGVTVARVATLVVNVAVLVYLIVRLRRRDAHLSARR